MTAEQSSLSDPGQPAFLSVATSHVVLRFRVKNPQWRQESPAVFGFNRPSQDSSQMFWLMAKNTALSRSLLPLTLIQLPLIINVY